MWLWPSKSTPDIEQEESGEMFPLMDGRQSNAHKPVQHLYSQPLPPVLLICVTLKLLSLLCYLCVLCSELYWPFLVKIDLITIIVTVNIVIIISAKGVFLFNILPSLLMNGTKRKGNVICPA